MTDPRGPLIVVHWLDSMSHGSVWSDADAAGCHGSLLCESIGWLMREDDDTLTLASHYGHGANCVSGDMTIPKVAIVDRWEVKFRE